MNTAFTSEMTGSEIRARRESLESEAATLLGRMLFEFSRLDMNLGLCLVWVDGGSKLESLTKAVSDYNFHTKLEKLTRHVESKLRKNSKQQKAYLSWLERTHQIRLQRNDLVHGRWGIDVYSNKVVNVLGLPTSDTRRETKYSIEELAAVNAELINLQSELSRLREHWPL